MKKSTKIEEADSELLSSLKDQNLHNLHVSPVLAAEKLVPSSSNLGKHGVSAPEKKNDSSNVSFINDCEDSASWPKQFSTA